MFPCRKLELTLQGEQEVARPGGCRLSLTEGTAWGPVCEARGVVEAGLLCDRMPLASRRCLPLLLGRASMRRMKGSIESLRLPWQPGPAAWPAWGCHHFDTSVQGRSPSYRVCPGYQEPGRRGHGYLHLSDKARSGEETGTWSGRGGIWTGGPLASKARVFNHSAPHPALLWPHLAVTGGLQPGREVSDTISYFP